MAQTQLQAFPLDLFKFLSDLKTHNNREWFAKNKVRYEESVRDPCLEFVRAVGPQLSKISPHLVADPRPVGGSMFRIYRDVRFSKDKSPYKTHAGIHFPHRAGGRDAHAPGYYLHLEPGESFVGGGIWHPDPPTLRNIRDAIAGRKREWRVVKAAGFNLEGETLQRPPAGYSKAHPFVEDLKRKDFVGTVRLKDSAITKPRFVNEFVAACRTLEPLNVFLVKALGLPW